MLESAGISGEGIWDIVIKLLSVAGIIAILLLPLSVRGLVWLLRSLVGILWRP